MRDDSSNSPIGDGDRSPDDVTLPMKLPSDLQDFVRRLSTFEARSAAPNRDALMFAAGQASAKERSRVWQATAALMASTSVALGTMILLRPEPAPRIVFVDRPATQQVEMRQPVVAPARTPDPEAVVADVQPREESSLGDAWKARQEMIARGGVDSQLAIAQGTSGGSLETHEQPLTRASFLGERSQESIRRWLKDQL